MKTKIIPFDLEMAKKIQAGEIEGKIKQLHGEEVEILCFDLDNPQGKNLAVKHKYFDGCSDDCGIHVDEYNAKGEFYDRSDSMVHHDLVLEVPDNEPQFKPFDKVLVRDSDNEMWICALFSHISYIQELRLYASTNGFNLQCIKYEENKELVGTTDKPKED